MILRKISDLVIKKETCSLDGVGLFLIFVLIIILTGFSTNTTKYIK